MTTDVVKHDSRFFQQNQTVKFGRVDAMIFNRVRDEAPILDEKVQTIGPLARMSESGALGWVFDVFNEMHKHSPQSSGMGDPLVRELNKRLRDSESYQELRAYTVADELSSALATCSLTGELAEKLPDEVKKKAEAARKAEEDARDSEEAANAARDDATVSDQQKVDLHESASDARAAAKAAAVALANSLRTNGRRIAQAVGEATESAKEEAETVAAACRSFGSGSGEVSGGLPPQEKFRLAKLVQSSGPAFLKLCKLLGRLTAEAVQKQASKTRHEAGAIADVTLGSDIGNVLDDELVQLLVPGLDSAMMAKLADDAAMQYEVENKEPMAKGDMVILLDESGSMSGQREAEAKGVALALAHICAKQKRRFVCHFFQDSVTHTVEIKPGDERRTDATTGMNVAILKLQEIALRGTSGGTNFDRPLAQAIQTVRTGGLDKADVLVITDGECSVSKATLEAVTALKGETGARVFTMLIGVSGGSSTAVVGQFSDKVWSCDSLLTGAASELFDLI